MTDEQLKAQFSELATLITSIKESLEREMRSGHSLSAARFEQLINRLDRIDTRLAAQALETGGISKSLTAAENTDTRMLATQAAQQRAIDDLAHRVTALERRLPG